MPKPTAVYVRVSTRDQRHDSQKDAIGTWLERNGYDPSMVEWYTDSESGRTMRRPEFERLQKDIFAGKVRTVVVYKVDRLARNLRDGLNVLSDWSERGVRFVSTSQAIDVSGTVGRMVAALMLGLAELELEGIRERQRAGIEAAKKRGVYRGRAKGTTKGKPERARELQAKGLTSREIAEALGCSPRTIFRYLETAL